MTPRFLTAVGLAVLGLVFTYCGGVPYQLCALGLITVVMAEWALICNSGIINAEIFAAAGVMPACWGATLVTGSGSTGVVVAAMAAVCLALVRRLLAVGILLTGLGGIALLILRAGPGGAGNVLFLAVTIWAADAGAWFGRTRLHTERLAPRLWPGLTEGSLAGGIVGGGAGAVAFALLWGWATGWVAPLSPLSVNRAILFGAMIGGMDQAGDALEGTLSRQFGREGGGSVLPGHDSLLDRVAGLLAAAPVTMLMRASTHAAHIWQ
jgi:phosphatidate cytidylyltransferase